MIYSIFCSSFAFLVVTGWIPSVEGISEKSVILRKFLVSPRTIERDGRPRSGRDGYKQVTTDTSVWRKVLQSREPCADTKTLAGINTRGHSGNTNPPERKKSRPVYRTRDTTREKDYGGEGLTLIPVVITAGLQGCRG